MKKIPFAFFTFLLFTGCKKDSNNTDNIPSVTIGSQVWMVKNLDVVTYRNGDPVPKVTDAVAWGSLTTGAYCYYNNDSATYAATYGKLYNWYAVNDARGLAPAGWHVPTDTEWVAAGNTLGGRPLAGGPMKEAGTTHWFSPNGQATNSSGFTALPGGSRPGPFNNLSYFGYWWTASPYSTSEAIYYYLYFDNGYFNGYYMSKQTGCSVRCVKD